MQWIEKSEKPPSLCPASSWFLQTENQRLNWRKPANQQDTKYKKPPLLSAKTENRSEPKIDQVHKAENANAHSSSNTPKQILTKRIFEKFTSVGKLKKAASFPADEISHIYELLLKLTLDVKMSDSFSI